MLTLAPEVEWVDDIHVPQDNAPIFLPPPPDHCPPSIVVEQVAPPTIDVAERLIKAEQHREHNKWKPPPKRKRARQPDVQAALKARKEKTNISASSSSAACSSVPPAPASVPVASGRSEPSRAAMPTDSSSSSDSSSDNDNSTDSSSDTSVEAAPKKKQNEIHTRGLQTRSRSCAISDFTWVPAVCGGPKKQMAIPADFAAARKKQFSKK